MYDKLIIGYVFNLKYLFFAIQIEKYFKREEIL